MSASKAETALERIRQAARNKAKRTDAERAQIYCAIARKGTLLLTTLGLAVAKRYNVTDKIGPVPWKPVAGVILSTAELMTAGAMPMASALLGGSSDALNTVWVDRAVASRSLVAGNLPSGSVTPIRSGTL